MKLVKRRRPEHTLQVKLCKWLTENAYPEIVWFAVGNGELRHIRVALRLKAEGVKPGVLDICFLLPGGRTAWLELKTPKGRLGDEQKGFIVKAKGLGHYCGVAKTLAEAVFILKHWKVVKLDASLPEEEP